MSDAMSRARTFRDQAPDPELREETTRLLEAAEGGDEAARKDLEDRFTGRLEFGTAGLRGALAAGYNRMNRVVVIEASWGFGRYVLDHVEDAQERGVVVAFDGRRLSRQFAEDTAATLAGLGIPAWLFEDPAPTPVAAFAVTHLKAAGGVMVTASHNPPQDNGYKVYWENGAQIIPPHDKGIAACIDEAPPLSGIARPPAHVAAARGLRRAVPDALWEAYLDGVAAETLHPGALEGSDLKVVYTAMHGVGHRPTVRALRRAGLLGVTVVPEQTDPDGTFPTVAFPNPEEPGAMDRAFALAEQIDADVVVAQDPDADRLAVALRPPGGGPFQRLSGNDVGVLLGADALEHKDTGGKKKLVCTTLVSSTMLSRIAANLHADYGETLTGFKWIGNEAMRREREDGVAFVLGYEEALGYSVGPMVRDKDGVSAVVRLLELTAWLKRAGKTLHDRLAELQVAHGLSADRQWSVVLPGREGAARIDAAMQTLRGSPPADIAGEKVSRWADLKRGVVLEAGKERPTGMPSSNVLVFWTEEGLRVTARPSGTEPKIKFYLDATTKVADREGLAKAREALSDRLDRVEAFVMDRLGLAS